MRALILLLVALPTLAEPVHPFPWMTGAMLLQKLERPRKPSDATEATSYLMGVEDATANREWCYSATKPGTTELQPALTDKLRSLTPTEAKRSAAAIAIEAWRERWPCDARCCHV